MDICLMGLDGSGKTTAAQFIKGYLQERHRKVEYIHTSRARQLVWLFFRQLINRLKGIDTICDRCYYDFIVTLYPKLLLRYKILSNIIIGIVLRLIPCFHIKLFFNAPTHILYSRKNELEEYDYKTRPAVYEIIIKYIQAVQIDATNSLGDIQLSIKQLIDAYIRVEK